MIAGIVAGGRPLVSADASDPYWSSVTTLLHLDGSEGGTTFVDQKGAAWSATGAAKLTTSVKKYGTASLILDGSSNIKRTAGLDTALGSAPFTLEAWIYLDVGASDAGLFFAVSGSGLTVETVGGLVQVGARNTAPNIVTSSSGLPYGAFAHLAIVRDTTNVTIFIDGVNKGSAAHAGSFGNGDLQLGSYTSGYKYLKGKIDDFRITRGVARYTSNFTPPSGSFPDA